MATTIRVWPIPPIKKRPPDILKSSSAKRQSICMNCHYCGHAWGPCQCGTELVTLNNKVKAPKKGDKQGWKNLILAYAWLIYNRIGDVYPCPELKEYESKCALGHRDDWKEREKILQAWVLKVDAEFAKNRNKK